MHMTLLTQVKLPQQGKRANLAKKWAE